MADEQNEPDEALDAVTVSLDHVAQSLKIVNDVMTEEWGKNGLLRQAIGRARGELRQHLRKAASEMSKFAAGRTETDAAPPYMEMVDVDDLKAACNVYEKRLAEEHAQVVHLKRSNKSLEAQVEKQKAEIEELKGLRVEIAQLEVTNEKVTSDLKREKAERIQGAGREYFLEEDLDAIKKEVKELREELQASAKDHVLDGGKPAGSSGGSMADAYDEQQQQETRDLRTRIEKQDIQME
jgi:ATP-dependent Lon protease